MKKWTIFTVLKVVEIGAVVFIPYLVALCVGLLGDFYWEAQNIFIFWGVGVWYILVLIVTIALGYGFLWGFIPWAIRKNIEWADKLNRRTK